MDEVRTIDQRSAATWSAAVEYPDSDELPMAENEVQAHAIRAAFGALEQHYSPQEKPYIASDLLLYYEEGNPKKSVAPDLMVVFGVGLHRRPSYKLWEEGKPPDFVLEVSSQSSRERDRTEKLDRYAGLGVREYFVFDPGDAEEAEDGRDGELAGYRLWGRRYVACGVSQESGRELESETLGLWIRPEGKLVRFRDPASGKDLRTHREDAEAFRESERGRIEAERQRDEAERRRAKERRERLRLEAQLAAMKSRRSDPDGP